MLERSFPGFLIGILRLGKGVLGLEVAYREFLRPWFGGIGSWLWFVGDG